MTINQTEVILAAFDREIAKHKAILAKEEKYCEIAARRLSQGVLPLYETAGKESE